jgi:uncharacterized membrane protein HdeD (DUF308 family)
MTEQKKSSGALIALGAIMIILGLLAIAMPMGTSFAMAFILGWILLFGGIIQLAYAFTSKSMGAFALKIILAIISMIIGGFLLYNPMPALLTLTVLLTAFLIVGGLFAIIGAFAVQQGRGIMVFGGFMSLILGSLIWSQMPIASLWVIGLLVGLNLLFSGFTMLAQGLSWR